MEYNNKIYNKFYKNTILYNKGFRNNKQILGGEQIPFILRIIMTSTSGSFIVKTNPLTAYVYNYSVTGMFDGTTVSSVFNQTGDYTINLSNKTIGEIVEIEIKGKFPHLNTNKSVANSEVGCAIYDVKQWGDIQWMSMYRMFADKQLRQWQPIDQPNLNQCTTLEQMFRNHRFDLMTNKVLDFTDWNTSNITSLNGMFNFDSTLFEFDDNPNVYPTAINGLNTWDVSKVTDFTYLFNTAVMTGNLSAFPKYIPFINVIYGWNPAMAYNCDLMFRKYENYSDVELAYYLTNLYIQWSTKIRTFTSQRANHRIGIDGVTYNSGAVSARTTLFNKFWTTVDAGLNEGTLNVGITNANKNGVTIVKSPDKAVYEVGEVVNISISKPYYNTVTDTVTIVSGNNNKSYPLVLTNPDRFNYVYEAPTTVNRSITIFIGNPSSTIASYGLNGNTSIPISVNGNSRSVGANSSGTQPPINLHLTPNTSVNDCFINKIDVRVGANISILTYGKFRILNNIDTPLMNRGKLKYVAAPNDFGYGSSPMSTNYFFRRLSTDIDYSELDLSDWNGYRISSAIQMFYGIPSLPIDPRIFDFTNAIDITNMFQLTKFTDPTMYDNWLIDLDTRFRNKALSFSYGGRYTSAGAAARASLISAGWTITDGGLA